PLVFLDYRGTGQSQPAWCPALEDTIRAIERENPPDAERTARTVAAFTACRSALEADGLALAGYTSAALAADAEDLRHALRVPVWNVYGVSFGTHVALTLVRDHPGSIRGLVLDSTFPPNAPYLDYVRPFAEALRVVSDRCAADAACAARFPDLSSAFRAAIEGLDAVPLAVPVDTNASGGV